MPKKTLLAPISSRTPKSSSGLQRSPKGRRDWTRLDRLLTQLKVLVSLWTKRLRNPVVSQVASGAYVFVAWHASALGGVQLQEDAARVAAAATPRLQHFSVDSAFILPKLESLGESRETSAGQLPESTPGTGLRATRVKSVAYLSRLQGRCKESRAKCMSRCFACPSRTRPSEKVKISEKERESRRKRRRESCREVWQDCFHGLQHKAVDNGMTKASSSLKTERQ